MTATDRELLTVLIGKLRKQARREAARMNMNPIKGLKLGAAAIPEDRKPWLESDAIERLLK